MQITEHTAQLAFALLAFVAFGFLLIERARRSADLNRFILIDALLVIVGAEMVFDALHDASGELETVWRTLAFVCRGALVAGAFALALTIERLPKETHK